MSRLFSLVKWGVTLGSGSQNFLGAKWVKNLLDRTSADKKRLRALQLLSLSPHYFLDRENSPEARINNEDYLNRAFDGYRSSRIRIRDEIIGDRVGQNDVILDYGCGPGFLANALSEKVAQVFAADISEGVIACAETLNSADGLKFILATEEGLATIQNDSLDAVVSFAVLQHVSDDIYSYIIRNSWKKLKPGGRLLIQIQLLENEWRSEENWRADRSIRGRLKMRYGLHCFGRTPEHHKALVEKAGFADVTIRAISEIVVEPFDDVCYQHLLTAVKPHRPVDQSDRTK